MCDPVTYGLITVGSMVAQGLINSDTAKKQAEVLTQGNEAARSELLKSLGQSTDAMQKGLGDVTQTMQPIIGGGNRAMSSIFGLADQVNAPLDANDPQLQRELQLARQSGAARGMSMAPSYLAETSAALLPGLQQRRLANIQMQGSLLSPIFQAGVGATGVLAQQQANTASGMANLYGQYGANAANLAVNMGNIQANQIQNTALDLYPIMAWGQQGMRGGAVAPPPPKGSIKVGTELNGNPIYKYQHE